METYMKFGISMLQNDLTLLAILTGLIFFGGMVLISFEVFGPDRSQNSTQYSFQADLNERRRSYQRITLPGMVQAEIPSLGITFQSTVWNISRSGICIVSPKWLGKGSTISMGLSWFGLSTNVYETRVEGSVVFCLNYDKLSILGIVFKGVITESDFNHFRRISTAETP